ncbi:ribonuclease E activity regulator RraA [Chromatiaceae bacterium AAb-1]|nr:ribonuclease E activity regulator RraA [Chromatiaceae bacterium AAb-1]
MDDLLPELCDRYPHQLQVATPILGNFGGRERFFGEIVTIKAFEDNSLVREQTAEPGSGKVLVIDSGGSMRCAMLGDILAARAQQHGWEGIVIYGCIRDVNAIARLDLGVQALGVHPVKTEKLGAGQLNIPLTFAGVRFIPGHYLYADNNGLVVSAEPLALPENI